MRQRRPAIAGTGAYVPQRVLTNADLEALVDTSNQWIIDRTGIRERRLAADDECTSTLATKAARRACRDAGIDPASLDLVLVGTCTPDHLMPSTACLVQAALGANQAAALDLEAACSGFLYATHMASGMIRSGMHRRVLVVGAETLSRFIDYEDRTTCILFGDGAGAAVLTPTEEERGILYSRVMADGSQADLMRLPAGGSRLPASSGTLDERQHFIRMEGRPVFKWASSMFVELISDALTHCELIPDDISLIVPHQVNERIVELAMKKLALPIDKCYLNLDRYGNTAAASVPMALHEAIQEGRAKPGDTIIMLAFGAGLTAAVQVVTL